MTRNGGTLLIGAMVVVGACEVLLHGLLGKGVFPALLANYLFKDYPAGQAFFMGMVDNICPAAILGCVNGWVGFSGWSARKLVITTFVLAVFLASLEPVYGLLIGREHFAIVWGSARISIMRAAFFHLYDVFTAFVTAGSFTYGAYVFRRDWRKRDRQSRSATQ